MFTIFLFNYKIMDMKVKFTTLSTILLLFILMACGGGHRNIYPPSSILKNYRLTGYASWYGPKFNGRRTASGEIFDMNKLTAAHNTLPFGTIVRVTNLRNGKSVVVKINDRGPFKKNRVIDLSYKAAKKIGMIRDGTAPVKITILKLGRGRRK